LWNDKTQRDSSSPLPTTTQQRKYYSMQLLKIKSLSLLLFLATPISTEAASKPTLTPSRVQATMTEATGRPTPQQPSTAQSDGKKPAVANDAPAMSSVRLPSIAMQQKASFEVAFKA
jgi:hypothetical protein